MRPKLAAEGRKGLHVAPATRIIAIRLKRFTETFNKRVQIDVHQHLWPEPLVAELARRGQAPRLRRRREGWMVEVPGEPEAAVDLADHDPDARAALVQADGLDRAYVALSSPLGIEALPADAARPLLDAWHAGAAALPHEFGAWAAPCLSEPDLEGLGALLDDGFVGACLPAEALASPAGFERCGPILELLEERGAALLLHPGPAPDTLSAQGIGDSIGPVPSWWPAATRYVAAMNAAWNAFAAFGRRAHPRLRVCFTMLAGLGPLHRERLLARGGRPVADPDVFLDNSSYGPRAIDAVIRELGVDALVYGSDRPVLTAAEPALGEAVHAALRARNPARLLSLAEVTA
jgi:6-methylsalicylate decarboxylase